jgi:ArsR family transcriptional regulator, arsenate/arsenite/antimonite-responsive transcriptional repressor
MIFIIPSSLLLSIRAPPSGKPLVCVSSPTILGANQGLARRVPSEPRRWLRASHFIRKGHFMVSQTLNPANQNANETHPVVVPFSLKISDLKQVIRTLSSADLSPLWEKKEVNAEERQRLAAVGDCLRRLRECIAASGSRLTLGFIHNNVDHVCSMYQQEVLTWAKENSTSICTLLAQREAELSLPSKNSQQLSTPAHVIDSVVGSRFAPTLSEEDAIGQARLLKALADPTRLRILSLLSRHEGEVCVFEIVEVFTLEQPTISHHLRILRDIGLVDCHKKGLWAYYYIRREVLERARDMIETLA